MPLNFGEIKIILEKLNFSQTIEGQDVENNQI